MPGQTAARLLTDIDRRDITEYLAAYQRVSGKLGWDEFRVRIDARLLEGWSQVVAECRRNGFIGPEARDGRIVWHQVVSSRSSDRPTRDLCTMCDASCRIADLFDSGKAKELRQTMAGWREPVRCWEAARTC